MARPALQRHNRDVADDSIAVDGERPRRARSDPRVHDVGIVDVLLEERAVALRDPHEKALHRGSVVGLDRPDLHHLSFGGSSSSLCSAIQSVSAGSVCLNARRPVAERHVAARRAAARRGGRARRRARVAGSAASGGTTLSCSRERVEDVTADVGEVDRPPAEPHAAGHQRVARGRTPRRSARIAAPGTGRGRATTAPSPGSPRRTRRSRGSRAASRTGRLLRRRLHEEAAVERVRRDVAGLVDEFVGVERPSLHRGDHRAHRGCSRRATPSRSGCVPERPGPAA